LELRKKIIIIGVKEEDGKPDPDSEGILYLRGLEERVTQIILDRIYPPVFPEIQVCSPKNNKTFVIIRIAESDSTPHWINDKTDIYVRTGNINRLEKKANMDEIKWLLDRRNKAKKLRENIILKAEHHFQNICDIKLLQIPYSIISILVCPLFPSKILIPAQKIENIIISSNVKSFCKEKYLKYSDSLRVPTGIVRYSISKSKKEEEYFIDHLEINSYGLIYKKRNFRWTYLNKILDYSDDYKYLKRDLSFLEIFNELSEFIKFFICFYNTIGYHGNCYFKFTVDKTLNSSLIEDALLNSGITFSSHGFSLEDEINIIREDIPLYKFKDKEIRVDFFIELIKDMVWSFGSEMDSSSVNQLKNINL